METIKYAIKNKNGRYYTSNDGWSKDIYKAELMTPDDIDHYFKSWPQFFENSKPVPISEVYSREEVK